MGNSLNKKRINRAVIFLSAVFILLSGSITSYASEKYPEKVSVGGIPFGVKFYSEGIVIVGFVEFETESGERSPAYDAGLRVNDIITHIDGKKVKTAAEVTEMIENIDKKLDITYMRDGNEGTVTLIPEKCISDGKRKTGMWIRDTTAGIGTLTYLYPKTGEFGGLGHGICDAQTGELLKMERGTVANVKISGVEKGESGVPGELKGYFTSEKSGILYKNTEAGVYGVLTDIDLTALPENEIEIADKTDVERGEAYIWCTLGEEKAGKYTIEIKELSFDRGDNRSFSIEVTDSKLIEKTGGIVQGMSGSPIIQNGKLVGAVTHVMVNDPTRGYGIFIENMLDAAG